MKGDAEDVFRIASSRMIENSLGPKGRVLIASLLLRVANCDDGESAPGAVARKVLGLRGRPSPEGQLSKDLEIYTRFVSEQEAGKTWDQVREELAAGYCLSESGVEKARERAQAFLRGAGNK